ncbi:MAG: hypothetical protein SPG57_01190 [Limosilactobacillus mucosae]|nr:hypothetical protein [Limosilactobacillus mucosae]MDY5412474.1 hypothetical protein [Limosilactobacillus mucosae]
MRELKKQLKHERNKLDEQIDELVEHLDQQRAKQTVSDTQLSLMETHRSANQGFKAKARLKHEH